MTRSKTKPKKARTISIGDFFNRMVGQSNLILAVGAILLGLLSDVLAGLLGDWQIWIFPANVVVLFLLTIGFFVLFLVYRRRVTRITMQEGPPEGKAGIILLLSTLNPRARGTPEQVEQRTAQVQEAVQRIREAASADDVASADFDALLKTNLEPTLRALEFHLQEGTLRDCWCIGTPDEVASGGVPRRGSAWLAQILELWFTHLHPDHHVNFHPVDKIKPRDYLGLLEAVDGVYRQSPFRESSIICDVTGGLKLMSVGAALACISSKRDMQYMASDRDWKGDPITTEGGMVPVLVSISPYWMLENPEE